MYYDLDQPPLLSEMAATRRMCERAEQDGTHLNFIGAGADEHHIPAVVSQLVARGRADAAWKSV
ncbi:MAG: hypothetical protein ABL891_01955 [Burkholderiales bacterium]